MIPPTTIAPRSCHLLYSSFVLFNAILLLHDNTVSAIGEEGTLTGNTYHVRGRVVLREDATMRPADILQQCFYGMGLTGCKHQGDYPRLPPYPFHWESRFVQGSVYCIECCDNNRLDYAFEETWSLRCDLSDGDKKEIEKQEIYDLEFRFARRDTVEDETIVSCQIPHQNIADSALTGYHLKIWVTEKSDGLVYYRGVEKCEVTTTEDEGPTAKEDRTIFWETITLINYDAGAALVVQWKAWFAVVVLASLGQFIGL